MRRSGGGGGRSRIGGLAAGRGGPLAPDIHLKRPYLPETPQDNVRDADAESSRVSKVGRKKDGFKGDGIGA